MSLPVPLRYCTIYSVDACYEILTKLGQGLGTKAASLMQIRQI